MKVENSKQSKRDLIENLMPFINVAAFIVIASKSGPAVGWVMAAFILISPLAMLVFKFVFRRRTLREPGFRVDGDEVFYKSPLGDVIKFNLSDIENINESSRFINVSLKSTSVTSFRSSISISKLHFSVNGLSKIMDFLNSKAGRA